MSPLWRRDCQRQICRKWCGEGAGGVLTTTGCSWCVYGFVGMKVQTSWQSLQNCHHILLPQLDSNIRMSLKHLTGWHHFQHIHHQRFRGKHLGTRTAPDLILTELRRTCLRPWLCSFFPEPDSLLITVSGSGWTWLQSRPSCGIKFKQQ